MTEAYRAAHAFARSPAFAQRAITRAEYMEHGSGACRRKFREHNWNPDASDVPEQGKPPVRAKGRAKEGTDSDDDDGPPVRSARRGVGRRKSVRGRGAVKNAG